MICVKCKKEAPDGSFCALCGAKQIAPKQTPRRRANNTGCAIKRGRTWTVIVPALSYTEELEDGTRRLIRKRRSKGGFRTKSEALSYAPILMASDARKIPTLHDLWISWSKNEKRKLSNSKQTAYEIAWERLSPIAGHTIDSLTTDTLQDVVNDKAPTYYPARDMKSLLSHLYQKAMVNQFVTTNLAKFIVLPDLEEKEAEPFSEIEIRKMWEAWSAGTTFIGYVLLMIYSGMMPAELLSCRIDMINWDSCEIYGCGRKTKKRKETPIVFAEFMKPILQELCAQTTSRSGKLVGINKDKFYSVYHKTLQEIGVRDLPPYSCRHTTATDAAKKNIAPSALQQLMRHSKITTTQRYIHMGSAEAHKAVNQLSK